VVGAARQFGTDGPAALVRPGRRTVGGRSHTVPVPGPGFPVVGVADLDRAAAFRSAALHLVLAGPGCTVFCVVDLSRAPSSG
jgi:hypothetical protein